VSERPQIALTFDDGPAPATKAILDVLAPYSARATFFVVGRAVRRRADLVRRMAAEGHELGNHTWSHPWLARDCDDLQVREELERTTHVLAELTSEAPCRFRAPHYDVDERVLAIAEGLGLHHTHGDITPPDWDERCSVRYMTVFVSQQARAGAIVGLHDGDAREGAGRQRTVEAVSAIVPRLTEQGFELVTASELLGSA
jgi:peptidoglycan/xylan/chitin deacetylase (PgdA/CDA1 family)